MIFLAITKEGLKKSLEMKRYFNLHIWCGSDVVIESTDEIIGLSIFNHPLKGEGEDVISDALSTIKEHHPNEVIWIEGR